MPTYIKILKPFERSFIERYSLSEEDRFKKAFEHKVRNKMMMNIPAALALKNMFVKHAPTEACRNFAQNFVIE